MSTPLSSNKHAWSDNEKEILMEMKKTCLIHMFLQSGSAYVNNCIHNSITIPNIVLGAILSITIFSSQNTQWKTASGVMAVISTILSSIAKQLGAGERTQMHCSVVRQYQTLIRDINTSLLMPPDTHDEKMLFIKTTKSEIDKIFSIQPDASRLVIRNFEKKYHKHIEMVLYPEFSNIEQTIVKEADNITKRMSRALNAIIRNDGTQNNAVSGSSYILSHGNNGIQKRNNDLNGHIGNVGNTNRNTTIAINRGVEDIPSLATAVSCALPESIININSLNLATSSNNVTLRKSVDFVEPIEEKEHEEKMEY